MLHVSFYFLGTIRVSGINLIESRMSYLNTFGSPQPLIGIGLFS